MRITTDLMIRERHKKMVELEWMNIMFMERVKELGVNMHWGTFSMKIPGRVGYQCSNYWRQMMKDEWVKDPNYWIRADQSFQFKRAKKGSIPDSVRKFSFVVLKDPSKTFHPLPGVHPKRPSDKIMNKFLSENVKDLKGKKKKNENKNNKNITKNWKNIKLPRNIRNI